MEWREVKENMDGTFTVGSNTVSKDLLIEDIYALANYFNVKISDNLEEEDSKYLINIYTTLINMSPQSIESEKSYDTYAEGSDVDTVSLEDMIDAIRISVDEEGFRSFIQSIDDGYDDNVSVKDLDAMLNGTYSDSESRLFDKVVGIYELLEEYWEELKAGEDAMFPNGRDDD